jgi:hypothetical protein
MTGNPSATGWIVPVVVRITVFCTTGVVVWLSLDDVMYLGPIKAPTAKPLINPDTAKISIAVTTMVRDAGLTSVYVELRAAKLFI